jgi:hypothetical protein
MVDESNINLNNPPVIVPRSLVEEEKGCRNILPFKYLFSALPI